MSDTTSGILTIVALVGALALVHVPFGNYMAAVFTSSRHLRAERAVYRVAGVDPSADQKPMAYALSAVGFSAASIVFLYAFLRLQSVLPWSRGLPGMAPTQSFNTAISFVTNTNWQSYSGESTLGYLVQAAGLAVQNFASAAVGLGVAIALVRGLARSRSGRIGNFWVDLVRGIARILLPLALVAAVVLVARGVIQNVTDTHLTTLAGHATTIPGGPVASQEAIKEVGTNGGGYFNANSAHPYENPDGLTDILEIFLLLLIPSALPRTFGKMVGDTRQGVAILAVMTMLWGAALALVTWAEVHGPGLAPAAAGAAMEGKETRFGEWATALFATSTTGTSTGAVNGLHDSLTAPGGGVVLLNILLGEVAPGGVGSGLYGMLVMAVVTVFLAGLMVGRTPEYLGKKISRQQITLVALYVLATPALVLVGTGIAMGFSGPRASMLNSGPHGLSEVMYAFSSAANNNGSAFGGLSANTPFYNVALGLAMLFGRFVPLILVVALAGSFSQQPKLAASSGTMPTHTALFAGLLVGVVLILTGLTYFPALALGPIAESLS